MPRITVPTPDPDEVEGFSEHEHGFCIDPYCPCKESHALIEELAESVDEGFASASDANRIYHGRVV